MTPEKQQRLQACLQEVAHILYLEKPTSELQDDLKKPYIPWNDFFDVRDRLTQLRRASMRLSTGCFRTPKPATTSTRLRPTWSLALSPVMHSRQPLEMLKGLGVWEENPQVAMPVFANHLEVPRIAGEICDRFKATTPKVPALLIRDHGATVRASSLEGANNYLEVAEYIFR